MSRRFEMIDANGCSIRAAVEGEGPLVLMVHGWPESWYSWRHQMGPIAAAGYTAAAMDVRGYGGSSKPHEIEAYTMETIVGDVQAVADKLGGGKAILIGHDWGAPIVWNSALSDPGRFKAVAGLSLPFMGRGRKPFIDIARELFTDRGLFFYQIYYQDEGVVEAEVEADMHTALRKIYYSISGDAEPGSWPVDKKHGSPLLEGLTDPDPFPAWLTREDIDYLVAEFEGSGFRGPINRYRNHRRDFEWQEQFEGVTIDQPALFITGDRDMGTKMMGRDVESRMRQHVTDLRGYHVLEGCGHWTQQERPAEVTALLLDWLKGI